MNFNLDHIRKQFPLLSRVVNGKPLVYLDSAASAQKPQIVIDAESRFYQNDYAAVHRGIHTLSTEATRHMENVRIQVAEFINATSAEEIVFVKGTTEAINLVANSWGCTYLKPGDNIIITVMEHHANIVPWQMISTRCGVEIRFIEISFNGMLDIAHLSLLMDNRTRLLAITHVSNVLGTQNPVKQLVSIARKANVVTLVDGAQAIMHHNIDVQDIACDFYAFSGHKMYGPTGIGILYGRKKLLDQMPPWEGGGAMINSVSLTNGTTYSAPPWRFEAGSPNTAAIIGLGASIKWIDQIGFELIVDYEKQLIHYAFERLSEIPDIIIYGPRHRVGVISFNLGKHHPFDIGSFLDQYGIAIRTGHHCAMPLMQYYKISAMCRASFAIYNSKKEIDSLAEGLIRIHRLLK